MPSLAHGPRACFHRSRRSRNLLEAAVQVTPNQRSLVTHRTLVDNAIGAPTSTTKAYYTQRGARRGCNIPNMTQAAFMLKEDGTASDPFAFQAALKSDQAKLDILRKEPETLAVMLGDNIPAMQSMLRSAFQVDACVVYGGRCLCPS